MASAILLGLWLPLCGALVASPASRSRAAPRRPLALYAHGGAAATHGGAAATHDGTGGTGGGLLEGWMRLKSQHDDLWQAFRRHAKTPSRRALARDYAEGAQITLIGAVVNLFLATGKAFAGYYGHSSAMMCDAAHSFSDLLSDALTLIALRLGALPPDADHPYGHGRFETIGCLAIGAAVVSIAIASAVDHRLPRHWWAGPSPEPWPEPEPEPEPQLQPEPEPKPQPSPLRRMVAAARCWLIRRGGAERHALARPRHAQEGGALRGGRLGRL